MSLVDLSREILVNTWGTHSTHLLHPQARPGNIPVRTHNWFCFNSAKTCRIAGVCAALNACWTQYPSCLLGRRRSLCRIQDTWAPCTSLGRYFEFSVAVLAGCWDTLSSQNTISFSKSQVDILLLFARGETHRVPVLCEHKGPMKLGDCKRREVLAKRNTIHICHPNIFLLCVSQPDSRLCSVGYTHPGCWLS